MCFISNRMNSNRYIELTDNVSIEFMKDLMVENCIFQKYYEAILVSKLSKANSLQLKTIARHIFTYTSYNVTLFNDKLHKTSKLLDFGWFALFSRYTLFNVTLTLNTEILRISFC